MTEWVSINKILDVIKDKNKWSWIKNPKCKYITLRIDTRDMKCVIMDRDNNIITLEELKAISDKKRSCMC